MVIRSQVVLRKMLEGERERLKVQLQRDESWADESMGYGNHMADDATAAFEQAKQLSVRSSLQDTLLDGEEALRKFGQGTYGVCESCGTMIDWARLEAMPEAKFCIKCQQRSDFGRQ